MELGMANMMYSFKSIYKLKIFERNMEVAIYRCKMFVGSKVG